MQKIQHYLIFRGEKIPCLRAPFSLSSAPAELLKRNSEIRSPGVFTTFRTFAPQSSGRPCRVLGFSMHIERVTRSACALGILSEAALAATSDEIRVHLQSSLQQRHSASAENVALRVRIIIRAKDCFEITTEPLRTDWDQLSAVELQTVETKRIYPQHKSTATEASILAREDAVRKGAQEALLTVSNVVTEGAWSNFFYIDASERLCTSAECLLPGITRHFVLRDFEHHFTKLTTDAIPAQVQYAFVCNSTSGIIPVSRINQHLIPHSENASAIHTLTQWYDKLIESEAEEVAD